MPKKVLGGPKGSRISLRVVATDLRKTLDGRRSDGIAKSGIDLHRELRPVEMEGHADTSVIRILGDALGGNRVGNRRRDVGFAFHRTEFLKDSDEAFRNCLSGRGGASFPEQTHG